MEYISVSKIIIDIFYKKFKIRQMHDIKPTNYRNQLYRYDEEERNLRKATHSILPEETKICPVTGEEFIPMRYNQIYFNREVQIKHNNLQYKIKNSDLKKLSDAIKSNAKKLKKLYNFMNEKRWNCIPVEYLNFEKVDIEISSRVNKNNTTGGVVHWCLDYGFEPVDNTLKFYFLHKKQ